MERIIQFGEGNFLRAFAEEYIQELDEAVVLCQPRTNNKVIKKLNDNSCRYRIIKRGRNSDNSIINNEVEISCISRAIDSSTEFEKIEELFCSDSLEYVISNTTEAGIAYFPNESFGALPSNSFVAKITYLLYKRYECGKKPLVFLPMELIENNGAELKNCIEEYCHEWELGSEFVEYVNNNVFCNTLVDRIVTGAVDSSYCDVACEPYRLLVIECNEDEKLLLPQHNSIIYTDNLAQYRERKVKMLNGAHTISVLAGYMYGYDIVRDMINDAVIQEYISKGLEEIKSTINLPKDTLDKYQSEILSRFNNPYIDHKLLDISLNSVSKFRTRVLPSMLEFHQNTSIAPRMLSFSLAALIAFYAKTGSNREYTVSDSNEVIAFFRNYSSSDIVTEVMSNIAFWGQDLTEFDEIYQLVCQYYRLIEENGIAKAIREVINE